MSIVIDIIIVLIIILSAYGGYKKGIVDVGFKLIAFIISLLIAIILYSPITNLIIDNTEIDENIEQIIKENGIRNEENNNSANISSGIDAYVQNYSKGLVKNAQNTLIETAANPIARNVIGIGVMIILFLGSRIILSILKTFTNIITKIPILKQCNELAGLAYGILKGLLIIYVILAISFFVLSLSGDTTVNSAIQETYLTRFFYNNNIILKVLF